MRSIDPEWQTLADTSFGPWLNQGDLQYRAREIRQLLRLKREQKPQPPALVEIGSNRGRFLKGLCAANPEHRCYGIELKKTLCGIAARRLVRHKLSNGLVIHADARLTLPVFFGEESVSQIFVLFPDPWWKKRHEKRRMVDESFLELSAWVLESQGHFVVKTDVGTYAERVRELFEKDPEFQLVTADEVSGSEDWVLTTRERHCQEDGLPVHTVCARRIQRR